MKHFCHFEIINKNSDSVSKPFRIGTLLGVQNLILNTFLSHENYLFEFTAKMAKDVASFLLFINRCKIIRSVNSKHNFLIKIAI